MAERYVLAIDQGTTGSTALLFDSKTRLVTKAYREFAQHYPKPGWVEHDPEEIWTITLAVAREALTAANISLTDIVALGITNQRETTVVWDRRSGRPIAPAIVWQCRRTADRCHELKDHDAEIRKKTGLMLDPYFSATKISWLLDQVPDARRRAEANELAFGTIDTWLIWKLTNGSVHATDYTNASRTLLFDIHKKEWSKELCEIFRVPLSMLPEVRTSAGLFGTTASEHLGASVPILGVAGDQQAALFGHYAVAPNQAKCTFGTGAFALAFCGDQPIQSKHGLLTTLTCDADGKPAYGLEGSIFMAGAIVQWLRDGLKLIEKASETEAIAASIADTGGIYLVPAFVGLGAPYWDPKARAAIVGMTRGTNRSHIVRAALEAIAFQSADLVDAMAEGMGKPLAELRVDGGAVANHFLMQFLADILGIPIIRPEMIERTGFGAARLAAVAASLWNKEPEREERTTRFTPKMEIGRRHELKQGWRDAVNRVRTNLLV
ncbi:MAG TPA: glycerol kinase GlpK [Bdellovibrionota bacterium]|nr:glycerol kinase GlpK [Bdellovibrionota bacterium]